MKHSSKPKKILLVGNPNVGKSVLFNYLTNSYSTVSNYPGTSVEIASGKMSNSITEVNVLDTPGIYSLLPLTEEENVSREMILKGDADLLVHVMDSKNIQRMLNLTLQLMETGIPILLILNVMDEAKNLGMSIHHELLSQKLGIPVLPASAAFNVGLPEIKDCIFNLLTSPTLPSKDCSYTPMIENLIQKMTPFIPDFLPLKQKFYSLLLLQGDKSFLKNLTDISQGTLSEILKEYETDFHHPLHYLITVERGKICGQILENVIEKQTVPNQRSMNEKLSRLTMNPLTGIPILIFILYWGLYKFLGEFGSGTVVDFLEGTVFEGYINPFLIDCFQKWIPWTPLQNLFVGEYGLLTLGLRYSLAIILPIVALFFFMFSLLEDSGYLPRLSMLVDRLFKSIGLSGRAIIPMVLGLGCDTMATLVTRTLPTKKERIIATLLLALAVPCSAQLGVIIALLGKNLNALLIWFLVISFVFLFIGFLSKLAIKGESPSFYMEIPPLRLPLLSNILIKTFSRIQWYLIEIIPMFLLASVFIWLGELTGIFNILIQLLSEPVKSLGLPEAAAPIFLFGFFRRDYGASGLFDLNQTGALSELQLIVACVALTLFLPCIAQFLMNVKERGLKTGISISLITLFFSYSVAFILNIILHRLYL